MDLNESMNELAGNPDAFRRRRAEVFKQINEIIQNPPTKIEISVDVTLDETVAPNYAFCRSFFSALSDDDVEKEFIKYILVQGLNAELSKLQSLRDHLYGMGSLEPLADANGIELTETERRISSMGSEVRSEDRGMEEYWSMGYITTRCPQCRRRAVWHPERHDLICLDNCGMVGKFEERPGPGNERSQ